MEYNNQSTIYGPVKSWRFGMSLGIDPLFYTSTCSFNCLYCQLGNIQDITTQIKEYVSTEKILNDYQNFLNELIPFDLITFSGSGEPTLASNLGEISKKIRSLSPLITQNILTNATMLGNEQVIANLQAFDLVTIKLDAYDQDTFKKVNRPHPSITFENTLKNIVSFRNRYQGKLEVQSMFLNFYHFDKLAYADLLKMIRPDLVQLNTPKRPYPSEWNRENRGNHKGTFRCHTSDLKTVSKEEMDSLLSFLKNETGFEIISVYQSN